MENTETALCKLIHLIKQTNSKYGNPKYVAIFQSNSFDDYIIDCQTATNDQLAYSINDYLGENVELTFHYTPKTNKRIIDSIKLV